MTKFEMGDDFKLRIGGQDLSGYMSNVDFSHDADDKGIWGEYLAGLQPCSMTLTLDNSAGVFMPGEAFWPPPPMFRRVTIDTPDGKWQTFKWELKGRFPRLFGRLKVRYVRRSFDAVLEPWQHGDEFGLSGTTTGPVSMGIEER